MLDYRTILHPTDFSAPAMYAFEVARDLARASGGDLLVVHVASPSLFRKRGYRRQTDEALRRLTSTDPKVRGRGLLLAGDPVTQIVNTASQIDCSLIVMGTSGRKGLDRLLRGNVSAAVQKGVRCPVLTTRLPGGEDWDAPDLATAQAGSNWQSPAAPADCCLACGRDV